MGVFFWVGVMNTGVVGGEERKRGGEEHKESERSRGGCVVSRKASRATRARAGREELARVRARAWRPLAPVFLSVEEDGRGQRWWVGKE